MHCEQTGQRGHSGDNRGVPASTIGTTAQVAAALGVQPADIRWLVSQHPDVTRYGTRGRRQYDVIEIRDLLAARQPAGI